MNLKLAVLLLCMMILSGCWDTLELDQRAIVTAIGFDTAENSMSDASLSITLVISNPRKALPAASGGSGNREPSFFTLGAQGSSLLEALESAKSRVSRALFFGHLRLILFGETLAKEGVRSLIDELARDPDVNQFLILGVTRGQTARAVLQTEPLLEKVPSSFVTTYLHKPGSMAIANTTHLWEFYRDLNGLGREPGMMTATSSENQLRLAGSGVFSGARLVGWLEPEDTIGFNFMKGNVLGATFAVPGNGETGSLVVRDMRVTSKVEPQIRDGQVLFKVKVWAEGDLGRLQGLKFHKSPDQFVIADRLVSEWIEHVTLKTFAKLQELGVDMADFGNKLFFRYPKIWKEHGWNETWSDTFRRAQIQVDVVTRLRRKGLLE